MQDVSAHILGEFAACLSTLLGESAAKPAAVPAPTQEPIQPAPALDLTRAVRGALAGRVVRSLGIAAAAGFVVRLWRRRRSR
jgi:hypothetical protein